MQAAIAPRAHSSPISSETASKTTAMSWSSARSRTATSYPSTPTGRSRSRGTDLRRQEPGTQTPQHPGAEPQAPSRPDRGGTLHPVRAAAGLQRQYGLRALPQGPPRLRRRAARLRQEERSQPPAVRPPPGHERLQGPAGLRRGQDADPALAQGRRGQRPLLDRDPAGPRVLDRSGAANGAAAAEAEAPANGSAMPDANAPAQADEMDRIPF